MTEVFKKRMKKHRQTLNWHASSLRKLKGLEIYLGEVRGLHERNYVAFNIQDGIISVNDLLEGKDCRFDFTFDMRTHIYKGRGTRTDYKDCERYICYILILLEARTNEIDDGDLLKEL